MCGDSRDLIFGATKTLDLYVHPFVSLDAKPELIGIVPTFRLEQSDENILRCVLTSDQTLRRHHKRERR